MPGTRRPCSPPSRASFTLSAALTITPTLPPPPTQHTTFHRFSAVLESLPSLPLKREEKSTESKGCCCCCCAIATSSMAALPPLNLDFLCSGAQFGTCARRPLPFPLPRGRPKTALVQRKRQGRALQRRAVCHRPFVLMPALVSSPARADRDGIARREWNPRPRSSSERLNSFHDRMQRAVEEVRDVESQGGEMVYG